MKKDCKLTQSCKKLSMLIIVLLQSVIIRVKKYVIIYKSSLQNRNHDWNSFYDVTL